MASGLQKAGGIIRVSVFSTFHLPQEEWPSEYYTTAAIHLHGRARQRSTAGGRAVSASHNGHASGSRACGMPAALPSDFSLVLVPNRVLRYLLSPDGLRDDLRVAVRVGSQGKNRDGRLQSRPFYGLITRQGSDDAQFGTGILDRARENAGSARRHLTCIDDTLQYPCSRPECWSRVLFCENSESGARQWHTNGSEFGWRPTTIGCLIARPRR